MATFKNVRLFTTAVEESRVDRLLADSLKNQGLSRSIVAKLIKSQGVVVNGKLIYKPSIKVYLGDTIEVKWVIEDNTNIEPQDVPFKVIWMDEHIIVISKPAGVVVHPGTGNPDGTLVNGLLFRFPEIRGVGSNERPGIVHRLDKETSGLMVIARSQKAYHRLVEMIKNKEIYREYRVAALGQIYNSSFTVTAPIFRDPNNPLRMAVVPWGKPSITRFKCLRSLDTVYGKISILRAILSTGRTHQIRVHLRHVNLYPLGDEVYGNKVSARLAPRVFLHSTVLKFIHPFTGKQLAFLEPIPDDLLEAWKKLEVR